MLEKITFAIMGVFEKIKDFLIAWGIKILVVLLIGMVLHNIVKMGEVSSNYQGDYKRLIAVYEDNQMMNVYSVGEGDKTIVILAGFGAQSPIIQYKTLVENLKDTYKVVVIEYFGYGYSSSIKVPRTNENIASEIKKVLEVAEITGPYILMPHSSSNIYAMYFEQKYPDLVQAVVSIDGTYPGEIKDNYRLSQMRDNISNINMTSIFELTGFERVLSYVSPSTFYINKMKEMPYIYSEEDISIYRNRIGSSYLTRTMIREINNLEANMNELKDYKYPDSLPVLEILATDSVNKYTDAKNSGESKIDLKDLAQSVITNRDIQKVKEVKGDHMLQLTNPTDLLNVIRNFLESI